jgi:hypothetical protein
MGLERTGRWLDWLQRFQALWIAVAWAIGPGVGGFAIAKMNEMTTAQAYIYAVGAASVSVIAYALWHSVRADRETGLVNEPDTDAGVKERESAPVASPEITVEHYGGNDATLVVRNTGSPARFTGEGQFVLDGCETPITRQRPFRLSWQQPIGWTDFDNIGAGHFGTVILSRVSYSTSRTEVHLAIHGDGGGVEAWNLRTEQLTGPEPPKTYQSLKRIRMRITIRALPALGEDFTDTFDLLWSGRTQTYHVSRGQEVALFDGEEAAQYESVDRAEPPPGSQSAVQSGQPVARAVLDSGLPLNVNVSFNPNVGSGATPGLWIRGTNQDGHVIRNASLTLTGVLLWNERLQKYVETPELYPATGFNEIELGKCDLFPDRAADLGFLREEQRQVLMMEGARLGHRDRCRINSAGTWQLVGHVSADGRRCPFALCLQWDGKSMPQPCVCPQFGPRVSNYHEPVQPITSMR